MRCLDRCFRLPSLLLLLAPLLPLASTQAATANTQAITDGGEAVAAQDMHEKSRSLGRWFIDSHFQPNNTRVVLSRFVPNYRQQPWAGGNRSFQQIQGVEVSLRHALSNYVGVELNSYYVWADSCQTLYSAAATKRDCSRVLQSKGISVGGELGTRLLKRWYSGALAAGLYYENLEHRGSDNDIQSGNVPGVWFAVRQSLNVYRFSFDGSVGMRGALANTYQDYEVERVQYFGSFGLGLRFNL
ncbi:hypothetical protein [Oceanobacter antarcticus]|uniref:Outer membrane protein beta-barrel domain-containing protein n=1 Tax=Oceanobacter antarcticus TaxID=3133425 RepID=A0ABW8NN69_9GAMM